MIVTGAAHHAASHERKEDNDETKLMNAFILISCKAEM